MRARTATFVGGYLLAWTGFGLLGWTAYQAARQASSVLAWDLAVRWLTAAVVLVAASYELTPAKYACLRRCRSLLSFLSSVLGATALRARCGWGSRRRLVRRLLLGADGGRCL